MSPIPWWSRSRYPGELLETEWKERDGLTCCYPTYWSIPRATPIHAWGMYRSLFRHVAKVREEFKFDVILATWAYPDVVAAARIARELGVPLVAKVHGSDINELATFPRLRRQIRWALSEAHRVIAVSRALGDKLRELGVPEDRILVQPNAVNGERFSIRDVSVARAELGLPLGRKLIGFIGRLSHEKGLDLLLDAMAQLVRDGMDDTDLLVVGDGAESASLSRQARSLDLDARVRFVGSRLPAEVPHWLSACDVICLPSRREGCPNVVIEALASGRPVVGCRVGGVAELLDDRNGVLVEPESAGSLAAGVRTAFGRVWEPAALRETVPFLSWDAVARSVFTVLREAVDATRPAPRGSSAGARLPGP
jgi:glycosyltransferase involved in cell wall biosynthesis